MISAIHVNDSEYQMRLITSCRSMAMFVLVLGLLFAPLAQAEVIKIDNAKLKQLMAAGVTVVDIRRPDEWQDAGLVEGSRLLTFFHDKEYKVYDIDEWMAGLAKIITSKDQPVILICRSGNRTGTVGALVNEMGYKTVYAVEKGINLWIKEGNPTVPYQMR